MKRTGERVNADDTTLVVKLEVTRNQALEELAAEAAEAAEAADQRVRCNDATITTNASVSVFVTLTRDPGSW